jgi:NADP-dependent 3-hydroxy acid dehydrogenase YdfG
MAEALAGRVALVTGASSGIGEAAAVALAGLGARIAVTARRAERLQLLVNRIEAAGGKATAFPGDIADETFATRVVERAAGHFGRLDILVNSAGVMPEGGAENGDLAAWRRVIETNLMACLYTSRAAARVMRAQGAGDIINISSTAGRRSAGLFGAYCTSKFGLGAMTEGLRQEVGSAGVRVCLIEPGATDTELFEGVADPVLREAVRQRAQRDGAMKADDVAAAITFVVGLPTRANISELLIRPTTDTAPL